MNNIERAAEVIEQAVFRDGFGIRLTAKSLADAGLLTSEPVTWFRREDYDAAPVGTIVRDPDNTPWQKTAPGIWNGLGYQDADYDYPAYAPCEVLYTPKQEQHE